MQMKKSYKMKMKTYQISQNGATDSTKCMMLSFSLGINKQTNIMMKNDAQMRNQSVNHFSIIQTSNTHTHTHSQKTKNRGLQHEYTLTHIHVSTLSSQMAFILVLQIIRANISIFQFKKKKSRQTSTTRTTG